MISRSANHHDDNDDDDNNDAKKSKDNDDDDGDETQLQMLWLGLELASRTNPSEIDKENAAGGGRLHGSPPLGAG